MKQQRFVCLLAVTALLVTSFGCSGGGSSSGGSVDSSRDNLAVWEITGGDIESVFETMAYNIAVDRLWQFELYRRTGRGQLAEIFGPDMLESDQLTRIIGYSNAELQSGIDTLDPEGRAVLAAYVAGINRRVTEVRSDPLLLPGEFNSLGIQPEFWTTADLLAWMVHVMRGFDSEALHTGQIDNTALLQELSDLFPADADRMFTDLRWRNDPDARSVTGGAAVAASHEPFPLPLPTDFPPMSDAAQNVRERMERIRTNLEKVGAKVKFGSYGWCVSGSDTHSGLPTLYSGPQMGFDAPPPLVEGSIRGGGLDVTGMAIPGLPGFLIGRTRNFAWGLQVGHAHTVDYYLEPPLVPEFVRDETIKVLGESDVTIPVYRSERGPVIEPIPFVPVAPVISWRYANAAVELKVIETLLSIWRARNVEEFGNALFNLPASMHVMYAGKDGTIAYFMSGRDPVRAEGTNPLFLQNGDGSEDWPIPLELKARPQSINPASGYFAGWNDKASPTADNSPNNLVQGHFGVYRRGHVIADYIEATPMPTFAELRDLSLRIATTDSFSHGGKPHEFILNSLTTAAGLNPTPERMEAIQLIQNWDGQFIPGGPSAWATGETRDDASVLADAWLREIIKLMFEDELETATLTYEDQPADLLFNVLLHALDPMGGIQNTYFWFLDRTGRGVPTAPFLLMSLALDNVLADIGSPPYDVERGVLSFVHPIYGEVQTSPFANRSTWAQAVEMGSSGASRSVSLFSLGQSGFLKNGEFEPIFDENYFSQHDAYNAFNHTPN